jgi:DinB superfamily
MASYDADFFASISAARVGHIDVTSTERVLTASTYERFSPPWYGGGIRAVTPSFGQLASLTSAAKNSPTYNPAVGRLDQPRRMVAFVEGGFEIRLGSIRMANNWQFTPFRREEIVRDLRGVHSLSDQLWSRFDEGAFFRPLGGGWSPAQNVVHLTKSTQPVANALGLPKLLLALLFRRSKNGSSSYASLRDRYQGILAAGGGAGRFAPRELPPPSNPADARARLLAGLGRAVEGLARRTDTWSETDLDRYQLPHPLLGKLTVREMLLFTVQHLAHHASKVEQRLGAAG